jgi:integrase
VESQPVVPFTLDELDRLRATAAPWFEVALALGAEVGLRQGEATGLTIDRVGFLARTLTIDRQLVTPAAGVPHIGPPADVAVAGLARRVELFGTGRDGLVLHEGARPVSRQRFGLVWRRLSGDAGLPGARFHGTRHTYASTLLSGGVSVAAAADYLGHSPAVLLKVYAHLVPTDHDRARAVVQAAFGRAAEDQLRTRGAG